MLTQLHRLLCAQLSVLGCAVYQADAVPPDATFPYVTLRIEPSLTMTGDGSVTMMSYHHGSSAHEERLATADALSCIVPASGLPLWLDCGLAVLYRPRQASVTLCADHGVLGVSVRFDLRLYLNKT
ncbi:MAG: hypothetical protein IJZ74_10705 [Clostridia bacterium]|nr:hypothetical protein [Clostridia bacterium]